MIINNWPEKIKSKLSEYRNYEQELSTIIIMILLVVTSYGLGRLTKLKEAIPPVKIIAATSSSVRLLNPTIESYQAPDARLVASKKGSRFYYPWCGGAGNIKEENKIYFSSPQEALLVGYTLAANCDSRPN